MLYQNDAAQIGYEIDMWLTNEDNFAVCLQAENENCDSDKED